MYNNGISLRATCTPALAPPPPVPSCLLQRALSLFRWTPPRKHRIGSLVRWTPSETHRTGFFFHWTPSEIDLIGSCVDQRKIGLDLAFIRGNVKLVCFSPHFVVPRLQIVFSPFECIQCIRCDPILSTCCKSDCICSDPGVVRTRLSTFCTFLQFKHQMWSNSQWILRRLKNMIDDRFQFSQVFIGIVQFVLFKSAPLMFVSTLVFLYFDTNHSAADVCHDWHFKNYLPWVLKHRSKTTRCCFCGMYFPRDFPALYANG